MKLRFLAPVSLSVALIGLLVMLFFWSKSLQEDIRTDQARMNPSGDAVAPSSDGSSMETNGTSAKSSPSPESIPPVKETPFGQMPGPMEARAEDLESVHRESFKHPHLLKVRAQEPEVLFVANQLLALPEDENIAKMMQIWVEGQDWISMRQITDSAVALTWEGHSAERFVEVRDLLQEAFGAGTVFEPNMIVQAMAAPNDPSYSQ